MPKRRSAGSGMAAAPPRPSPSDAERLARVRAIPRRGTAEDLARALDAFRRYMAQPPLAVDWETLRDAEADRV